MRVLNAGCVFLFFLPCMCLALLTSSVAGGRPVSPQGHQHLTTGARPHGLLLPLQPGHSLSPSSWTGSKWSLWVPPHCSSELRAGGKRPCGRRLLCGSGSEAELLDLRARHTGARSFFRVGNLGTEGAEPHLQFPPCSMPGAPQGVRTTHVPRCCPLFPGASILQVENHHAGDKAALELVSMLVPLSFKQLARDRCPRPLLIPE